MFSGAIRFRTINSLQKRWIATEINQVKRGNVVEMNGKLFAVLASIQRSQARGGSHYKLELKDLRTGGKAFTRVNAGQFLETVELQQKEFQFMYADDSLHVIDQETFEEMVLDGDLINAPSGSKCIPFLTPETMLTVSFHEKKPISIKVPERVQCKVVESGIPQTGSTDGAVFKLVTLDNGCQLSVPEFIQVDDTIVVNIHTMQYHSRI